MPLATVNEIARHLHIHPQTVRNLTDRGEIPQGASAASSATTSTRSRRHMFQDVSEGGAQQAMMRMRDAVEPGRWIVPFARTPMSLFRAAIRRSVGAPVALAMDIRSGAPGDTKMRHAAESVLAVVGTMALYAVLFGGDDDDDDLPRITGSNPLGGRKFQYQQESYNIPPDSVRIGKNYYSYRRMEPFGSALSLLVTALENFRDAKEGKPALEAAIAAWGQFGRQFAEHPMLSGLNDMISALEAPERQGQQLIQNMLGSFVPNVAKSSLRAADPLVRERRGMSFGESMAYTAVPSGSLAEPKIDVWGRDIGKAGTTAGRYITPFRHTKAVGDELPDALDSIIRTWNRHNPSEQYIPEPPGRTITKNKVRHDLTPEQWTEYKRKSGEYALKYLEKARLNVNDPTQKAIDRIKGAMTRARAKARAEILRELGRNEGSYHHKHEGLHHVISQLCWRRGAFYFRTAVSLTGKTCD